MKRYINKLRAALAVLTSRKFIVLIDKDTVVVRYTCGVTDEEMEELINIDFDE